jgi:histidinol-phosphate aminotransferase
MSGVERRSDLVGLTGYHSAQVDVEVRLNTNESPFPPPATFVEQLSEAVKELALNRYPDRTGLELRTALGRTVGMAPDRVLLGNGSNEVIQSLLLAFGGSGRRVLTFEPTYALHSHIARITGTEVVQEERNADFTLDPARVGQAVSDHEPAVTFLCSPNNPTGMLEPTAVVEAALAARRGLVVVDEAYGQFAPSSALDLLNGPAGERLVVLGTFSKTWALAGLRLGYGFASPDVIEACEIVTLPYHLSSLVQRAGLIALEGHLEMEQRVAELVNERERIQLALGELGLDVWPSAANFILFKPLDHKGHDVWQGLIERSILIRDCSSWRGLEGCLRVTVGTVDENDRFLAALKEVL